ncbi:MAG: sensor histidine kinase [Armatimonadota bacterium]
MLPQELLLQLDQIIASIDKPEKPVEVSTDGMDAEWTAVFQRINTLVSRLGATQSQLDQSLEKQASLRSELDAFAYVVSHDLKTPLRGISSLSQWIVSDYSDELDKAGREHLAMLNDRVMRMNTLIDGVLRFWRAGRGKGQCGLITLEPMIRQVAEDVSTNEKAQIIADEPLPLIDGEPSHLSHILSCLLDNSLRYNQNEYPEAHVCMKDCDDGWVFCVYDNGVGIPPDDRDLVFDLFQTVRTKQDPSSSGVGLTIVKKIVDIHNGQVWFEDSPLGGVQACFTLPSMKVYPVSHE